MVNSEYFPKNMHFVPPFRLGRKQKRAVLDSNGLEVVIFPVGAEKAAQHFTNYINREEALSSEPWVIDWA